MAHELWVNAFFVAHVGANTSFDITDGVDLAHQDAVARPFAVVVKLFGRAIDAPALVTATAVFPNDTFEGLIRTQIAVNDDNRHFGVIEILPIPERSVGVIMLSLAIDGVEVSRSGFKVQRSWLGAEGAPHEGT